MKRPLFDTAGAAESKAQIAKLGKPPVDIASDYMSAMYQHAMKHIAGKFPNGYLDTMDKQFVLSVPAVWSDKAKDTTEKVWFADGCPKLRILTLVGCSQCRHFSGGIDQGTRGSGTIHACVLEESGT